MMKLQVYMQRNLWINACYINSEMWFIRSFELFPTSKIQLWITIKGCYGKSF